MDTLVTHVPVLLHEVLEQLPLVPGGRMLDLTLGLGGHAEAILARADESFRYYGVDRDPDARALAGARLGPDPRLTLHAGSYEEVWDSAAFQAWRQHYAPDGFDCILADLGISTLHIKDAKRGFSFMHAGPLDMRMDPGQGPTALEWMGWQTEESLANALYQFGEEKASRPIARAILQRLKEGKLNTTLDLAEAVYTVLPQEIARRKGHSDPATRTFQAVRIAVNGELTRLSATIEQAVMHLKPFGRIGIISFHSLEDRIVKQTLRRLAGIHDGPGRTAPAPLCKYIRLIHAGGMIPTEAETEHNPPSRSARLRIGERLADSPARVL